MEGLFVGADISKDSFSAAAFGNEGMLFSSYPMDCEGFGKFLEIINAHCLDLQRVLVSMESTGCYHINLFYGNNTKGSVRNVLPFRST